MNTIQPFLWFNDKAEEAAQFYVSVFPDARILETRHYGPGAPRPEGTVMTVRFSLRGDEFIALNGGPHFSFTPAISFVIPCETQAEVDHYWNALTAGGEEVQCGWLKDRYGLSWQVVPREFLAMIRDVDRPAAQRAFAAMMTMKKLDIGQLRKAFEG